VVNEYGGTGRFDEGIYGCSEMMVDGFLYLLEAGILSREVFDHAGLQELINQGDIGTIDHVVKGDQHPQYTGHKAQCRDGDQGFDKTSLARHATKLACRVKQDFFNKAKCFQGFLT